MKVFSKGYKNKSTPSLNTLAIPTPTPAPTPNHPTSKPKHMNKLKTFKQILTQNVQITALKIDNSQKSKNG
jgi:hypothetical protein